MKLMVLLLCVSGLSLGGNQAESSETSTNKLSPKPSLNSIPSAPAQKTTLLQQQQPQPQYLPYKPVVQAQPAMLIIAQPNSAAPGAGGQHSPVFQHAVQQLLSYYNNNPQAKYHLLQQQQQHGVGQQQQQHSYAPQMPTGALHVIPSPQLDNPQPSPTPIQQTQHLQNVQHVQIPQQQPQATYIIPAQSLQTLQGLNPGLLAQLTGQQPQHIPVPVQFLPQQQYTQHFVPQQIPQFAQHFALPPQFATGLSQPQIQPHQLANVQIGASAPSHQFLGGKAQSAEFITQSEKSSSSNYNPVYRTAYVKG